MNISASILSDITWFVSKVNEFRGIGNKNYILNMFNLIHG